MNVPDDSMVFKKNITPIDESASDWKTADAFVTIPDYKIQMIGRGGYLMKICLEIIDTSNKA